MKALFKPATDNDIGECINLIPNDAGCISHIEATKNAVVVQVFEHEDEEGEKTTSRIICIECVDSHMLPALKAEAEKILKV